MNFGEFAKEYMKGKGNFNELPIMIQDCVRSMSQIANSCVEYDKLRMPVLMMTYGNYDYDTIMRGIHFFRMHEIHSFIFAESSTATLSLLECIMNMDKATGYDISCSCSERFSMTMTDRWGGVSELHGLVIKLTEKKKVSKAPTLRGDLIG